MENFKQLRNRPMHQDQLFDAIVEYFAVYIVAQLSEMRRNDPVGVFRPHYVIVIPPCVTDDIAQAVLDAYKGPETGWEHSCTANVGGKRCLIVARSPYTPELEEFQEKGHHGGGYSRSESTSVHT